MLYPQPCGDSSDDVNVSTTDDSSDEISQTITESESISITTSSDNSDSTETADIDKYPQCFYKYSNQPNRHRCCFNSRYQVLYPQPCGDSSESRTTSELEIFSETESSFVTTSSDENIGTSSELIVSSSSDFISTSQNVPEATTIGNSTSIIESSTTGGVLPITRPILSVLDIESSISDATDSKGSSNPTSTMEDGHSSEEMLTTTSGHNSLPSNSVPISTQTSWRTSVAGISSNEVLKTSAGSANSSGTTSETGLSSYETDNPKKSGTTDYESNRSIPTLSGKGTGLKDRTTSALSEDIDIQSTTIDGITKTIQTTVYVTTSPDKLVTTETAVIVVVTNDSTATTYTEMIQTTVVEGKTLTTTIPIPQDKTNKIYGIEYSTILPTTLPNGQVTSIIEKIAVAVNDQGQRVTKTAPLEIGAYTTKGFEISQDNNDMGNLVAEGYNPSAGLGGSTPIASISAVSNENSASLSKVNLLLVKFLLLVLLIV